MIDRLTRDNLIDLLDEDGKLFQDIRLKRHGGKPVLLHKGRNSEIYDMYCPDVADEGHKKEYILKVTYYDKGDRASIAYADSLWNQRRMGNFSKYVVHIEKTVRIDYVADKDGYISKYLFHKIGSIYRKNSCVWLVVMEKLQNLTIAGEAGRVSLLREELKKPEEVLKLAKQIGEAIKISHKKKILHRDIKLENIFWNPQENVYQLGDFGDSILTHTGLAETIVYSNGYAAPEIHMKTGDSYNCTADIYSFGIVLYVLLNDLKFPCSENYCVNNMQYNPLNPFPAPCNSKDIELNKIIRKMCSYKADDRYQSMEDVLYDIELTGAEKDTSYQMEYENATETYRTIDSDVKTVSDKLQTGFKERHEQVKRNVKINYAICACIALVYCIVLKYAQEWEGVLCNPYYIFLCTVGVFYTIILFVGELKGICWLIVCAICIYTMVNIGINVPTVLILLAALYSQPAIVGGLTIGSLMYYVSLIK
ncbi:MAG: protein kinase [Lachnospira sp.]|nr:protein kinase [Lachnospira sp.]